MPAIRLLARVPAVVRRDYLATAGSFWLTIVSGLLLFHLVAQRSGVAGFTYYQVARGAVATVQPLALAGLVPALHRYLPRAGRRIRVLARQVFLLEVVVLNVLGLITLLFAEDVGRLFGIGGAAQVRAVVLLTAGDCLCTLAVAALRGCGAVRLSNLISLIGFGAVPLAAFAVTSEIDVFLALQGATLAAMAVWGIVRAGPRGAEKAPAGPRPAAPLRTLLRYGIRRAPGDIALPGLFAFPTFFVAGASSNSADAGYVGFTTSAITMICAIFGMLTPVLLPRLSRHAHDAAAGGRAFDADLVRGLRVLPFAAAGVAALASAVVVITASPVVHWFLGADFHGAVAVVRFGVPVSVPLAVFYAARPTIDALREAPVTMELLVGALAVEVVATYLAALVVPAWPAALSGFAVAAVSLAVFSYLALLHATAQAAPEFVAVTSSRPSPFLVVVIFVTTLAGHFTLSRAGLTIPILNDVRVLLFSAVLMAFVLEVHHAGVRPLHTAPARRSLQPVLLLFGYQMLSAAWAPHNAVVGDVLGDLLSMIVLVSVYATLAEWDRERVVRLTMSCLYVAGWLYFLYAASGRGRVQGNRWTAFGGGPNVFVRVEVLALFATAYFYFRSGGRLVWLVGAPAFLLGAVASGSRGGLIALGLTTALAFPSLVRFGRRHGALKPLAMLPLIGAVIWLLLGDTIMALINERFLGATVDKGYTSDRDVLYAKGIWLFLERPIAGVGVHGFYAITNLGPGERYVHDLPLAVAVEGGAIGLLLLLLAFGALRHEYATIPRARRSLEARVSAYSAIFILGTAFFSGDYYDARFLWIFLLLATVPAAVPQPLRPPSISRVTPGEPRPP